MSFSLDVGKWAEKAGEDAAEANAAVLLSLFRGVIMDTPVLEGRLRGNWIATKSKPSTTTRKTPDPSGKATTARAMNFVDRQDLGEDFNIYLTNNLPYAHRIEYDGWSHTKAPAGMVRTNLIRIASKIQ
tara:strand:+ start:373 stop:759 length:387 start_codon:yes stop_codon:yes gene_type:complete